LVEHHRAESTFISPVPEEIWLVSKADPAQRHLLFKHEREAEVVFSEDEKWLVINDHNLSNESRLLLFTRKASLEYVQVADLTDATWAFFAKQNGRKNPDRPFDHAYVEALRWANDDPPTLLLCLDGHLDHRNFTSEWYCLYNVQTKAFSIDFAAHNKAATALEPE
jgi:hypothetical protein